MRQNVAKMSGTQHTQQEERILAEAKHDKLRYLEEVHSAQRRVNDLQAHLKVLESKLADKDAEIRILQEKKSEAFKQSIRNVHENFGIYFTGDRRPFPFLFPSIPVYLELTGCGSSFDSYNSYGLAPLAYASQASYNPSNNSFNATTTNTASLLEQAYSHPSASMASSYTPNPNYSSSEQRYLTKNTHYHTNKSIECK